MPDTLKSWLYEHRNKLIVGTILTFVAALLTIPTHLAQNLVDRFYPPSNTPAATSTSTPSPTNPSPILTTPSPSVSPTTQTPTNSPSPTNTPTPMPTTSRSPEWNPTLNQAVAKSDCGREGWRPGDWTSLGRSSETTALSQKVYNNGFKCELTKTLDDGSVDILIPKGANTFTVGGGQSDNSRNTNVTVTFEVINPLSNEVLDSASLPLGQTKEFRIDVSGIPRLTLKVLAEASAGESTKNAINVQPVWADPKFS